MLWNRTFVVIRLAFIQAQLDFIRSEGEMKCSTLYVLRGSMHMLRQGCSLSMLHGTCEKLHGGVGLV